jgi:hypothetical protein
MIRSIRRAPDTRSPLAAVPQERANDDVRILREIVSALCERVELLETQALLIRPLLVARVQH